jgi:hypothetical protein
MVTVPVVWKQTTTATNMDTVLITTNTLADSGTRIGFACSVIEVPLSERPPARAGSSRDESARQ